MTSAKSETSYTWFSSSASAVRASIESAKSCVDSAFLVAVTTTSSTSCADVANEMKTRLNNKVFFKNNFMFDMNDPLKNVINMPNVGHIIII